MGERREGRRMERGYEGWPGGGGGRIVRPGLLGPFHRRLQMFSWSSMARVRSLVVNDIICLEGKKKKRSGAKHPFIVSFLLLGWVFFPVFLLAPPVALSHHLSIVWLISLHARSVACVCNRTRPAPLPPLTSPSPTHLPLVQSYFEHGSQAQGSPTDAAGSFVTGLLDCTGSIFAWHVLTV